MELLVYRLSQSFIASVESITKHFRGISVFAVLLPKGDRRIMIDLTDANYETRNTGTEKAGDIFCEISKTDSESQMTVCKNVVLLWSYH